ncbi:hypothetical protein BZA77DRAFT_297467 [Pyronema omphalodes]|nr:hypothetical protein BZA77DRAFT_297467 [Pyronema omphalodes]
MDRYHNLQLQNSSGNGINYDSGIESSPTSQTSFEHDFDSLLSPGMDMSWLDDFPNIEDYLTIPEMVSNHDAGSATENMSAVDEGIGLGTKVNEGTSDEIELPRAQDSLGSDAINGNSDSFGAVIQTRSQPLEAEQTALNHNVSVPGVNEPTPLETYPTRSTFENASITPAILQTSSGNTIEYQLDSSFENHLGKDAATATHGEQDIEALMSELFGDDEPEVQTATQDVLPHGLSAIATYNAQYDNEKQATTNSVNSISHESAPGHDDWLQDAAEFRRIALELGNDIDALRGRATAAVSKNKALLQQITTDREVSVQQIEVAEVPVIPQEIVNLTPAVPPVIDPQDREYAFGWNTENTGLFKFVFVKDFPGHIPISEIFSAPLPTLGELEYFKKELDEVCALNADINEEIWFYRMLMQQAYNCVNAVYIAEVDFSSFIISRPGAEDRYNAWADIYNQSTKIEGFYNVHSEQADVINNQNTEDFDAIGEDDTEMADLTNQYESYADESDMIDSLLGSPMDCEFDSAAPSPNDISIPTSNVDIEALVAEYLTHKKTTDTNESNGFERDIVPNLFAPGSDAIPTFNVGNFLDEELSNITIGDPDGKVRAKNLELIKRAYNDVMRPRGPETEKMCRLCFYSGHTETSNVNQCPAARLNSWIHKFPVNGKPYHVGMTEKLGPIDQFFHDKGAIGSAFQWVSHAVHCGVADELGFGVHHAERLQDLFLKCHELHSKGAIINNEELEECDPANATIAVGRLNTQHVLSEGVIVLKRPPLISPDGILFNQGNPVYPGVNDGAPEQESEEVSSQSAAPKKKRKRAVSKIEVVYNEVCDKAGLPHLGDRKNSVCANCSYRGHIVNSVKTCPYAILQECNHKIDTNKGWRHDSAKYDKAAKQLESIIRALDEVDDSRAECIQMMLDDYYDKISNADNKVGQKRKATAMSSAPKKVREEPELTIEQLEANVQQALLTYRTAPDAAVYRTLRQINQSSLALKNCLVRHLPVYGNRPDTQCPNCLHFGHDQRGKSCPLFNVRDALDGNDGKAWNACLRFIPSLVNAYRFFSHLPEAWSKYARDVDQLEAVIQAVIDKYENKHDPVVQLNLGAMDPALRAAVQRYIQERV